ncbi:hypothetical protein ATE84_3999 [Aquimarina sp. MAR_2010_214]|uniref:hypothetical protein n=1 Tax=Aquimarina sp. MAR_2010_214 TaxID=1250026 RepID=UPI000C708F05|nr:hypothetical protein [Aquimarina sp. MAR_2010_214]PKV51899.1 hypothetical protein ATE84_3999 [Aquimarina sp. MAR_2010_214]
MRSYFLILCFTAFTISSFSQKSSPVAGDAATLIDLLKKDYNSINPETKAEEIIRDRARVLGVFKSYYDGELNQELSKDSLIGNSIITDENSDILGLPDLTYKILDTKRNEYPKAFNDYNRSKKTYNNLKNIDHNSTTINKLEIASNEFTDKQEIYYNTKYYSDSYDLIGLYSSYNQNTYLKHIIEIFIKKYNYLQNSKTDVYSEVNYQSSIQKSLPFLGGDLSFETVIDGLSRFLAKRIKEELTTYVINKIKEDLNDPKPQSYLNELMTLLPRTTDYIKGFEADQVLNFIDEIKQYIEDDLSKLLENASNLKETPRFKILIENNPDLDFAFEALEIYPQLSKIKNPVDYFDMLDNSRNISRWAELDKEKVKFNIGNSLRLSSMIAHSLTVLENSELKFVSTDFMSNYGSEVNFYFLYIGFLNQQNLKYYNVRFVTKTKKGPDTLAFDKLMSSVTPQDIDKVRTKVKFLNSELTKIASNTEKIYNDALAIKKAKNSNEDVAIEDIHSFIEGIINLGQQISISADELLSHDNELNLISKDLEFSIENKTSPYFKTAHASNDIMLDLHNKKYSTAIIKTLEIPTNFTNSQFSIDKILEINNQFKIASNLILLQQILQHNKIPSDEDKLDDLKNTLLYLKAALSNINSTTNTFISLKKQIDNIHSIVNGDVNNSLNYITYRQELENNLRTNYEEILLTISGIDLDDFIVNPINTYLVNHGYDDATTNGIISKVDTYLSKVFELMIIDGQMSIKALKSNNDYKIAEKELIRNLGAYLPEIASNVFKIKSKNVIKTIHFINDIALSESAEDVESAIDAFALPSGSYSLKKKKGSYVSINSFPGILGGFEQRSIGEAKLNSMGFTAPIGLYTKLFNIKGVGLFLPIIDIAAPVRFRLDNENNTKTLPEFTFKNIISPGLYLTYTPWDSPVTFNLGAQYGPELQIVNDDNTTTKYDDSFRIGLGVTLDIPLVTLFNKPQ